MDSSGGRVVAGSNPVTPTGKRGKILIIKPLFIFQHFFQHLLSISCAKSNSFLLYTIFTLRTSVIPQTNIYA